MHVLQLVVNGIMAGTILAVPAIGLTAIFAVLRFTNFALGLACDDRRFRRLRGQRAVRTAGAPVGAWSVHGGRHGGRGE